MLTKLACSVGLLLSLTACDRLLDVNPVDEIPADDAFADVGGARTALAGAYNSLQSASYYGGDLLLLPDVGSDDGVHIGIYNEYADADGNDLRPTNSFSESMWAALYSGIHRTNVLIQRVPSVPGIDPTERDQILGEAYFLRALHYHNIVKLYGGAPLRLVPAETVEDAGTIARATVDETYAQIISDLQQAELLMTSRSPTTQATPGAAKALLARVYLYQQDWANAVTKADEVIGLGYDLAPDFGDLFDPEGEDTDEDIFKVIFTGQDYQYMYYWLACSGDLGGGCEMAPSQSVIDAFADPFNVDSTDTRFTWSIVGTSEPDAYGTKYPTSFGAEDIHVIRFAEVLLIKAEALAQQNQLGLAVDEINKLRVRAHTLAISLGVDVTSQQEVLDEINRQRRLELLFEGDRWPDLVRSGRIATVFPSVPTYQYLYPIPQSEIDVAPNITQNPGY